MKKFLFTQVLIFGLIGCTNTQQENITYRRECMTCQGKSYTVRKPVEIVYEDVTYTTVYEPKTYVSTKTVRKPYNHCERKNLCK